MIPEGRYRLKRSTPVLASTLDGIKYNKQNIKILADQQSFLFMDTSLFFLKIVDYKIYMKALKVLICLCALLARKRLDLFGILQSIIWLCIPINDVRLSLWLLYIPIEVAAFHHVIEVPLLVVSWFLLTPSDFFQLVFLYSAIMFL